MSTRDLTKEFLRYRAQRSSSRLGGGASPRYSSSDDSAHLRLTGADHLDDDGAGDVEHGIQNDGAGHRQWMDFRDAVENNFYEMRGLSCRGCLCVFELPQYFVLAQVQIHFPTISSPLLFLPPGTGTGGCIAFHIVSLPGFVSFCPGVCLLDLLLLLLSCELGCHESLTCCTHSLTISFCVCVCVCCFLWFFLCFLFVVFCRICRIDGKVDARAQRGSGIARPETVPSGE